MWVKARQLGAVLVFPDMDPALAIEDPAWDDRIGVLSGADDLNRVNTLNL